jgi:hypothetical protein
MTPTTTIHTAALAPASLPLGGLAVAAIAIWLVLLPLELASLLG